MVAIALLWLVSNGVYQVVRKPSELFFPISGVLRKHPTATWSAYGSLFRRHATHVMAPDLLAALAQVGGMATGTAAFLPATRISEFPVPQRFAVGGTERFNTLRTVRSL